MSKHDLSSRHFQQKISQFCELRIAPITSKRVLEHIRPFLISLIIFRKRPPLRSGQLDWTAIGQACGVEAELTVELKKQLRPGLVAIFRWLDGAPAVEEKRPPKPTARPGKLARAIKVSSATSTIKPQRATWRHAREPKTRDRTGNAVFANSRISLFIENVKCR